ncbi:hypothetical protein [Microcoleus sp. OTE_8_concoct_300]|uniref:hypothetical protein n=1 Tax=Microcoleus sp. OTE_8_concoct_300 TaxID=2964710 RepID=UPI00403FA31F
MMNQELELLGEKGYQSIKKIHNNSRTPITKTKNKELSQAEKFLKGPLAFIENYY